jgi:uncharacterized repeat protein (TIGR02543 family)
MKTKCPLPKGFSGTTRVFGILIGLLVLTLMAAPGAGAAPFAYISNFSNNTVTVMDGTTVLATVPVGEQPFGVAVNPAETRVYVANSNFFQNGVPSVSVINTADFSVATITANIAGQPSGVAVSPDGALVYVTDGQNGSVFVIDAATNVVVTTLNPPAGEFRQLGAIVVAGGSVYATDVATGEVVNVTDGTRLPVFVSFNLFGIAANSDGSRLFVANGNDTTDNLEVTVVDTTTTPMSIVGIPLRISQLGRDAGLRPAGIAVSPTGFVYVSILVENAVAVLNAAGNAIVTRIPDLTSPPPSPFNQPFGVAIDPTGARVYVGNSGGRGTATVLDGTTNTVVSSLIQVGTGTTVMNPMVFGSFVAGARPIPPPPQFVLSLSNVGSGTIKPDIAPMPGAKYSAGTTVNLEAQPDAGFAFTGWSGDCSGTSLTCSVVMDRARNVTATFTAQYTLYTTVLGPGTVTPTGGKYLAGTVVRLTAAPATDAVFVGWSGDACAGSSSLTCDVPMDRTKSVTATFALKQFVLTVTKNGTGSGTVTAEPSSTTWKYDIGATVTLTATPASGSQFAGWSGDACLGSTSPSCSVTMNAAKTVTATFTLLPPPPPPPPAPTTCDDKIKDLEKKVASDKLPWRHEHQLKAALRLYSAAQVELAKAKVKVGASDKRYVRALKEFNNGKAALCNGRYWHAHHELWESYYIAHEILKHRR